MRGVVCWMLVVGIELAIAKQPQPCTPVDLTPADSARLSAYTPKPEYPLAARQRHLIGVGIFRLHFQFDTGRVIAVQVERSTGHAVLDSAATDTLRRWRFKPDAMRAYRDPRDPSAPMILRV